VYCASLISPLTAIVKVAAETGSRFSKSHFITFFCKAV